MRPYIETTIIADWLLVETTRKQKRKVLTGKVFNSHKLLDFLIHGTNEPIFTSYWALFEATGVIKKSNILVRMVLDGIPANLYPELKEESEYKLENFQIEKIKQLISQLVTPKKNVNALRPVAETADIDNGVSLILSKNLEAPDSFHLGIALSYGCDYFISDDHHYFRKNVTSVSGKKIEIMGAKDFLKELETKGFLIS